MRIVPRHLEIPSKQVKFMSDNKKQVPEHFVSDSFLSAGQKFERNNQDYGHDIIIEAGDDAGRPEEIVNQAADKHLNTQIKKRFNYSSAPVLQQNKRPTSQISFIASNGLSARSNSATLVVFAVLISFLDVVLFFGSFMPTDWVEITLELLGQPPAEHYQPPDWGVYKYFL